MLNLTVVVPIFNEEKNLSRCIPVMIDTIELINTSYEIILVNDCSTDRSKEIISEFCHTHEHIKSINHTANKGFGGAIKSGFEVAKGQYVLYYPADSFLRPPEVQNYLALIKNADVVIGYRRGRPDYTLFRKLNSFVYYILVNLLFGLNLRDVNWVHMYRKEVLKNIDAKSNHIFFCAEMLIRAVEKEYIITGVDVTYMAKKQEVVWELFYEPFLNL